MKNLRNDIKRILRNECLSIEEKIQLKIIFKRFVNARDILSRSSVDFDFEEEQCFGLDGILNRNQ